MRIPVRWRDIDALGYVNNAVSLTYREELLTGYLGRCSATTGRTAGTELDFGREIRLADPEGVLQAEVERVGTSSVTTRVVLMLPDGTVAPEGRIVLVAWDPEARRLSPQAPATESGPAARSSSIS